MKPSNQQLTARQVRTFPIRFSFLRGDNINNADLSVMKKTNIREGKILEFRAEFINAFNHPFFNTENINIDPTSASFGRFVSQTQRNYPRRIQIEPDIHVLDTLQIMRREIGHSMTNYHGRSIGVGEGGAYLTSLQSHH